MQANVTDSTFAWSNNSGFEWWEQEYSKAWFYWVVIMSWTNPLNYEGWILYRNILQLTGVGEAFLLVVAHALNPFRYGK